MSRRAENETVSGGTKGGAEGGGGGVFRGGAHRGGGGVGRLRERDALLFHIHLGQGGEREQPPRHAVPPHPPTNLGCTFEGLTKT